MTIRATMTKLTARIIPNGAFAWFQPRLLDVASSSMCFVPTAKSLRQLSMDITVHKDPRTVNAARES